MNLIDNSVILAAHRSLLGSIGVDILCISLSEDKSNLLLNVFHKVEMTEEQIDALEVVTTELYTLVSDIWEDVIFNSFKVDDDNISRSGKIIFSRLGVRYK